jgi:ABC-type sugar transport system permease subunit
MRFVKTYWLEMLMVLPLFAYIIGFTLLLILTNIKESFVDQRFGRRYDILASKRADITYDIAHAPDNEEKRAYEKELAATTRALERLQHSPYAGLSLSNYHKLFTDRSFVKAMFNTLAITLLAPAVAVRGGHVHRPGAEPTVSRQRLFPHHRADTTWHPHHRVGHDHDLYL